MELFSGRPENTEGRLQREVRTYDFLDELGIEYKRTDHEPANTMEACNEIDKVLAEHYGFTEEELDFIINYDIKYRMGDELGGE